jgi:glycosyltransferase involved in cell wall biosynthesis
MNAAKGVRTAIEVARQAGVPLRIAAKMNEPAEQAYFAAEIKPLLGSTVEFLGELNAAEKFELLGGAMALLNPIAWDEPFGMVMIESLATGTPVVTTPRGSAPEIVTDGVTGFVRRSTPSLADALLDSQSLNRMECRAVTQGHFSARRMAAEYVEVFARAVALAGDPSVADL